jgi:hypothetical protein
MSLKLPVGVEQQVIELLKQGQLSQRDIAVRCGVSHGVVTNVRTRNSIPVRTMTVNPAPVVKADEPASHQDVLRALKSAPMSTVELADVLDWSPKRVAEAIEAMQARGVLVGKALHDPECWTVSVDASQRTITPVAATSGEWNHRFGLIGDNHLCNKHSRLDVLKEAYDIFERLGITTVLNTGNWIDGEHRFTRPECIVRPGMDAQIDYMLENYPQKQGITTRYIAGDDHEGWYQQRECIEIGRYLEMRARQGGRTDLEYLGYAEADIELKAKGGSAVARVVHPGGGSAYAISYTDQKRVESYQGGEKPSIEFAGHYHKYNVGYPREVTTVQTGCTCEQTLFMRKKRLQAMVGFMVVEIKQDTTDGHIERVRHEWFPRFNRRFYENRY